MAWRHQDISISKKGYLLVSLPLLTGTVFLLILSHVIHSYEKQAGAETRVKNILLAASDGYSTFTDAVSNLLAYFVTRGDLFKLRYERSKTQMASDYGKLEGLVSDNKLLLDKAHYWHGLVDKGFKRCFSQAARFTDEEDPAEKLEYLVLVREVKPFIRQGANARQDFLHSVYSVYPPSKSSFVYQDLIVQIVIAGFALNALFSVTLALFFSRAVASRVDALVDNSLRLASGQTLLPRMSGADEIARVDDSFHLMADKLKALSVREKLLVENATDVVLTMDKNGRITDINPAVCNWGFEEDDVLGSYITNIVFPEDVDSILQITKGPRLDEFSLENRILTKDGEIAHILWSICWSELQQSFFCIGHDITERKIAEELAKERAARVRMIVESIPVGILICTEDGVIEDSNICAEQILVRDNAELSGLPLPSVLNLELTGAQSSIFDVLQSTPSGSANALEVKTGKDTSVPVELKLSEFFFQGARKVLVVMTDITERHELEQMKREFVAMVSHDLRTPLTSISVSMELFEGGFFGKLDEYARGSVAEVQKDLERLIDSINGLLEMEKLAAGKLEMRQEPIVLDALVSRALASISYLAEKKYVGLATDIEDCEVFGDAAILLQVVINLLVNSINSSHPGALVTVSARETDNTLEVKVHDQATTLSAGERAQIFSGALPAAREGGSFGLPLCKVMVEAHGGTIGVDGTTGGGNIFWFRIPLPA